MDGVEATQHIRALSNINSHYAKMPIVALTANAIYGIREMFLENGFSDYLSKPIDTVKLNIILEKWIPKEMQEHSVAKTAKLQTSTTPIELEIEGIDVNKGIRLSGGTLEHYYDTLATFHENGLEKIDEIKKCLETKNLSLYTTFLHALKGASGSIGADELSKLAQSLENAGQQEDLAFIEANTNGFLLELEQLLNNIANVLPLHNTNENAMSDAEFKKELIKLKTALEQMDASVFNQTVDELLKLTHNETIIKNISKHILIAEYDEAINLINSVLQE